MKYVHNNKAYFNINTMTKSRVWIYIKLVVQAMISYRLVKTLVGWSIFPAISWQFKSSGMK